MKAALSIFEKFNAQPMNYLIALIFSICLFNAQSQDILEIFNDQIDAYNKQDIERMVGNLHPEFKWYYLGEDDATLETEGAEAFRSSMKSYYSNFKSVKSEMTNVSVLDNKVSFKETVVWESTNGKSGTSKALGMYTFLDGKLFRAWYF